MTKITPGFQILVHIRGHRYCMEPNGGDSVYVSDGDS